MVCNPAELERLTMELVRMPSVTGRTIASGDGAGSFEESELARWIHSWLSGRGVRCLLQPLPDGRSNVAAFVKGASDRTVVLLGHFDTVPPSAGQVEQGAEGVEEGFLYGRGSLDMKSGIAVMMALLADWQAALEPPAVSVLMIATCDEENESAGVLRALDLLRAFRGDPEASPADRAAAAALAGTGSGRPLLGVVNVDYTTERYPGDPEYTVWEGTIGKVLAGVYVRGYPAHAGEYFRGFHAVGLLSRLAAAIEGNLELSGAAPPPVALRLKDTRDGYNVMTPGAASAWFNVFTTKGTPAEILSKLRGIAEDILGGYIRDLDRAFREHGRKAGTPAGGLLWEAEVMTWSQLRERAVRAAGRPVVEAAIEAAAAPRGDARERGMHLVERLLELAGSRDPAVVLCFLPPYYPAIAPDPGPLGRALRSAVERWNRGVGPGAAVAGGSGPGPAASRTAAAAPPGRTIAIGSYYPYISDMSYLRLDPDVKRALDGVTGELPGWGALYAVDLAAAAAVDLPVVNAGPYGFGAHQPEERVDRAYTFTILPRLIRDIVASLS